MKNKKERLMAPAVPVKWDTAKKLISLYNKQQGKLRTSITGTETPLSGFSISVSELKEVIVKAGGDEVAKIFIALGFNDGNIPIPGIQTPANGFTAIILGIDANNNLITDDAEDIKDYLDPCPNICPNTPDGIALHKI